MGRERVIQEQTGHARQEAGDQERSDNPGQAHSRSEHGNDLVRARHPAEAEEQRQEQGDREENDEDLGDLREIVFQDQDPGHALVQKRRDIVADVEDKPDRDKPRDAVKVRLEKITQDVAIEISFCALSYHFRGTLRPAHTQIANRKSAISIPHRDRIKRFPRERLHRRSAIAIFGEGNVVARQELRVPARTAGHGRGGRPRPRGGATSRGRGRDRRG